LLQNHDHLQSTEEIFIRLSDPLGINVTGEVGHEILVNDPNGELKKNLSSNFIYDENSITTGIIHFPRNQDLSEITLHVKAWDNANNPSEKDIKLFIIENQPFQLFNVLNFPNPFATQTQFAFELTADAIVHIDIFTLGGRRIMSLPEESFTSGYHYINWDGRDQFGERLANGIYLYRLKADNGKETVSMINRLAKFQ